MKTLSYLISFITLPLFSTNENVINSFEYNIEVEQKVEVNLFKELTEVNDSIINMIAYIESRMNINAKGDNGKAFGILQMWNIAVQDHNRLFKTNFVHKDSYDKEKSYLMCRNLLNYGIKYYYNKCGEYPTIIELMRMWNGSIYSGWNKQGTIKYVRKYSELQSEINNYFCYDF